MKLVCVTLCGSLVAFALLAESVTAQDAEPGTPVTEENAPEDATEVAPEEGSTEEEVSSGDETPVAEEVAPVAEAPEAAAEEVATPEVTAESASTLDPEPELSDETGADLASDLAEAEAEAAPAEAAPEEAAAPPARLPWRNSFFIWDHTVTTVTFDRSATTSYNPGYTTTLSLRPRWHITPTTSIRLRQDLLVEVTDTDTRAENRQARFFDTRLDLINASILNIEGFNLGGGVRFTVPISINSRAFDAYFGIGGILILNKVLPVLEGLALTTSATYVYEAANENVAHTDSDSTIDTSDIPGSPGATAAIPRAQQPRFIAS
ncbi:MAG: hypothetical protein AAGF12_37755, partial [Myxococcota bacterium]